MKKGLVIAFLLSLLFVSAAHGKMTIKCEIKTISQHDKIVMFSWEGSVEADKSWDACDLIISFLDAEGREIHEVRQTLDLKIGKNPLGGFDICDSQVWKRVKKYVTKMDCLFQK